MPVERAVIETHLRDNASLSLFLRALQASLHWVPREAMSLAADHYGVTYMDVYQRVAFDPAFSLEERGRIHIEVCAGLACREAGSPQVLAALERACGIGTGQTRPDGEISLARQACFGRCAIGPNVRVQGRIHSGISPESSPALVKDALV